MKKLHFDNSTHSKKVYQLFLEYIFKQVDGSNMEFLVMFVQSEIQILKRIWIYDFSNLLADIGGFLGLLLGASIYTFADLLVASVQKFVD